MIDFEIPLSLEGSIEHFDENSGLVVLSPNGLLGFDATWQPLSFQRWQALAVEIDHEPHFLGRMNGRAFFCLYIDQLDVPSGVWFGLRDLLATVSAELFQLAGRASQVCQWDRDHRFCGSCGQATHYHDRDRARVCVDCGLHSYPRISPCVIVLIKRGEECLLARNARTASQYFSALAGFVEAGESVEQCAHREVKEEVGLSISNLRYVGSQAWPFPGQLMLAFIADYVDGEISPDPEEIAEAHWYHYQQLPLVPPPETISGQLIEGFVGSFR